MTLAAAHQGVVEAPRVDAQPFQREAGELAIGDGGARVTIRRTGDDGIDRFTLERLDRFDGIEVEDARADRILPRPLHERTQSLGIPLNPIPQQLERLRVKVAQLLHAMTLVATLVDIRHISDHFTEGYRQKQFDLVVRDVVDDRPDGFKHRQDLGRKPII